MVNYLAQLTLSFWNISAPDLPGGAINDLGQGLDSDNFQCLHIVGRIAGEGLRQIHIDDGQGFARR